MRTYQFDKKGSEIQELLDQIKNKTIYGNATKDTAGLMSAEDKGTLDTLVDNVGENIQQLNSLNQAVSENTTAIGTNTDNIATNTSDISALKTTTGNLGTRLDAAEETLDNIFQLDANNFMGIYDAAASLPAMTGAGWALVGADLTALNAYVYNIPQAQWQQYGNTTYDYSDYSGLATQVATIGLKLGDLTQLETEEKTNLVDAINEVKDNASTTAQNASYTDNYGIGADNVQDAIDKVGFVGTDTEIDLSQYTEVRAYISPDAKWITSNNTYKYYGKFIPVTPGSKYRITGNNAGTTYYAYLTSNVVGASNSTVTTFAGGATTTTKVAAGEILVSTAPADAKYMWFFNGTDAGLEDRKPQKIEVIKEAVADYLAKTDAIPTKDSSKLVTSGGVYSSIAPIDEELHGKTIYNGYTEGIYVDQGTGNIISREDWVLTDYIPISSPSSVKVRFMTTGVGGVSCLSCYGSSKGWMYSYTTNGYTNEREVLNDPFTSVAYMRCGLYLPSIEQCEVYVDGELVWNYTGKVGSGMAGEIAKIPQIEAEIDGLEADRLVRSVASLGELTDPAYCITAAGKWSATTKHSVYFKDVAEGDVYRFLGNATNYGFYAFLKDTTMSYGATPSYADGETGRHSIPINTESPDITVPATANYLYICNTNDGQDQKPQALYSVKPVNDAVKSLSSDVEEIKDVLGIGGGGETSGFSYYGEKIAFSNTMNFSSYATNSIAGQSSAIYGDYLFIVKDKLTSITCYNMATRTLLYTLTTGYSKGSEWHCNQSQFGTLRVNENDVFPVLYTTVTNDSNGRCSWVAYRIIPTYTDNEISSFTIEEVQTIYLPVMTDENCLGNVNIAVDYERNLLWGYGRNNRTEADNFGKATFVCFPMPTLSESTVTYEDTDIIDTFQDGWSMTYAQGGFIKNGKLVIMQGYASVNLINLRVIDLYGQRRQVTYADLLGNGFTQEPEGVFYYKGNIYTSANSTRIWRISIS